MAKLRLTLAAGYYDRTIPIFDGRAPIEGCDVNWIGLAPEETFHRAFGYHEFDVTEMSLCSHSLTTARGDAEYIGIPAFVSRVFRHSGIYVRTDRIRRAEDLKGATIGMPEYQQTANVWVRGILSDDFGIGRADAKWRTGGLDEPGRAERTPITLPEDVDLQQIPKDRTLSQMLESGEIDAIFSPREPSSVERKAPNVGRLYPDYLPVEEAYYRRTRIFPIMHLIGIRRELAEQNPWLPVSVYKAFLKAKAIALEELRLIGAAAATLPWCVAELTRTRALMGEDFWNYGLEGDRTTLATFLRYGQEQGLINRPIEPAELFAPSTLDLSKN
jgi:4,5-dihydroxyphthalate decarboxylase